MADEPNRDERDYWNSAPGEAWVRFQDELDATMAPVKAVLLAHAKPAPGERVLDIGCGTGATSLDAAARVGADGAVLGVDISEPLLARARERGDAWARERGDAWARERGDAQAHAGGGTVSPRIVSPCTVSFRAADAQTAAFGAPFDLAISRFGVMFFDDPVAAFANILAAMRPGGRLAMATWAPIEANPWFDRPRKVAADLLGTLEPSDPYAPGPFAFADGQRVLSILDDAGWAASQVHLETVHLTHSGGLDAAAAMTTKIGPAARLLKAFEGGPPEVDAVVAGVRDAFAAYERDGVVHIPATINVFTAQRAG